MFNLSIINSLDDFPGSQRAIKFIGAFWGIWLAANIANYPLPSLHLSSSYIFLPFVLGICFWVNWKQEKFPQINSSLLLALGGYVLFLIFLLLNELLLSKASTDLTTILRLCILLIIPVCSYLVTRNLDIYPTSTWVLLTCLVFGSLLTLAIGTQGVRGWGLASSPNATAFAMICGIALAASASERERFKHHRAVTLCIYFLMVAGLFYTGSRSGLIVFGFMLIGMTFVSPWARKSALFLLVSFLLIFIVQEHQFQNSRITNAAENIETIAQSIFKGHKRLTEMQDKNFSLSALPPNQKTAETRTDAETETRTDAETEANAEPKAYLYGTRGLLYFSSYLYNLQQYLNKKSKRGGGTKSIKKRLESDIIAIGVFLDNPVIGVGLHGLEQHVAKLNEDREVHAHYYHTHNAYLWILAETGLIGFMLLAGSLLFLIAFILTQPEKVQRRWLLLLLLSVLGAGLFWQVFLKKTFWVVVALVTMAPGPAETKELAGSTS